MFRCVGLWIHFGSQLVRGRRSKRSVLRSHPGAIAELVYAPRNLPPAGAVEKRTKHSHGDRSSGRSRNVCTDLERATIRLDPVARIRFTVAPRREFESRLPEPIDGWALPLQGLGNTRHFRLLQRSGRRRSMHPGCGQSMPARAGLRRYLAPGKHFRPRLLDLAWSDARVFGSIETPRHLSARTGAVLRQYQSNSLEGNHGSTCRGSGNETGPFQLGRVPPGDRPSNDRVRL